MTTNEIKKLQAEHARYKAALDEIHEEYSSAGGKCHHAYIVSDKALNPPPPPPVTLEELKAALNRYNKTHNICPVYGIYFYRDESGSIRDGNEDRIFNFYCLREAIEFLNR